ncbi:MAG: sensor hybrid histidine kinase [Caulobacteraceae bacterium]|nr:sensor hybrid histidine kinase [Caulobacteraceae bacterium]
MPGEVGGRDHADWNCDLVHRLAEASRDCMWVLDLDGRLAYASSRSANLLNHPAGAGAARSLRDLWPEESRFSLDRALSAAAAGRVFQFRAFFHARPRAGAYWETVVSPIRGADGAVSNLLAVARDVTTEVETRAFLESVIHLLPSPLTVKNAADRRFVLMNRAAEDLFGMAAEDALGRTAQELFGDDPRAFQPQEAEVLDSGELRAFDHQANVTGTGRPRHFSLKLLATHDDLGPRHLIALGEDVTERREAAESLRAALQAAQQASEAKSAFLANMSHELRTPLNGIVAGADMLAQAGLPARAGELVDLIRTSSEALDRLLSDVLDIARVESGQIILATEAFHLGETVRSVAALFGLEAERKGLELKVDLAPSLDQVVMGDMVRLRQVLSNLMSNAVKFTQRGRIVLEAARTEAGAARFTVTDTGIGFDPAAKERIFGRFQQADDTFTRQYGGAGLGLCISRELVGLMDGTLDCDGRPGEGACFWFEIPLPAEAGDRPAGREARAPRPEAGLRILMADDHPRNRQVVQLMLDGVAEVVAVENGAEAVAAFRREAFDLVLMDVQMPVMDGLAAVREIRTLEAARGGGVTPVIMLTANVLPEHMVQSAEAGADLHLGKPVTLRSLFAAIEDVHAGPHNQATGLYPNFGHRRP